MSTKLWHVNAIAVILTAALLVAGDAIAQTGGGSSGRPSPSETQGATCTRATGVTLWVPGPWVDRTAFVEAVARENAGRVLSAGAALVDAAGKPQAVFDVLPHDADLSRAMFVGSGRSFDDVTRRQIDGHASVVCVAIENTGDGLQERMELVSDAVRAAGGFAVKVLKSGLSHDWARWQSTAGSGKPMGMFQALVLQVPYRERKRLCSFGMNQLGLADACIEDDGRDSGPAWALFEFNMYLWQQRPTLKTGHTFARNLPGAQKYKMTMVPDRRYPADHDYHNSHGVWEMVKG